MAAPVQFTVDGPIACSDIPGLAGDLCLLLERAQASTVICHLRGVQANGVALDVLARLRLIAARHGCDMRVHGASSELRDLIAFAGLDGLILA